MLTDLIVLFVVNCNDEQAGYLFYLLFHWCNLLCMLIQVVVVAECSVVVLA